MRRFLSLILLLPVLAACEEDATTPADGHIGVYSLQSVNGQDVPLSIPEDGGVFTIVGASLTLSANGSFAMTAQTEFTIDGQTAPETSSLAGTYTRTGNTVTFSHPGIDEGFGTASLSGNLLTTVGGDGEVLVFEK